MLHQILQGHYKKVRRQRIITLWAVLEAIQLKRQLRCLDKKVGIAYWNRHKRFRHNGMWLYFVHFPGPRGVHRYGLGIRAKTFKNGAPLSVSTFAEVGGVSRAKLIHALHSLCVSNPEEHVKLFLIS